MGVGYEEDTCSFTCNTGYELTGSDTRTCQNNGSWSGSDVVCSNKASTGNSGSDKSTPIIIIGTILGSFIIFLIIIILIGITILIRRRDKKKSPNNTIDGKGNLM